MVLNKKTCFILLLSNIVMCCLVFFMTTGLVNPISGNNVQLNSKESDTIEPYTRTEKTKDGHCEPLPPKDDHKCGDSIAERKCCEYKWQMNYKDKIIENRKCNMEYGFGVIGGENAKTGVFPHMAALGWLVKNKMSSIQKYLFMCGGSLISEKFVLTAAHCTYSVDVRTAERTPYMVRLGSDNIVRINDNNRMDINIKNIINHENYRAGEYYYDIALLELVRELIFTKTIHPACLSKVDASPFTTLNITGWGVTKMYGRQMSDNLQVASVKMIGRDRCKNMLQENESYYRKWKYLGDHQLCAGVETGGIDTCQGDSGGPLQMMTDITSGSMHTVVGITSLGHYCAVAGSPGIYTSVAQFLPWIEKTVWPDD